MIRRTPPKRTPSVKDQIDALNARVESAMAVSRFMIHVQLKQLTKAEQLRKLAIVLIKSRWQHRCEDKVGGITAVSDSALKDLSKFVKGLTQFHKKTPVPKSIIRILKGGPR